MPREELFNIDVGDGSLQGLLHHDRGPGPRPAVLVCRGVTLPGATTSTVLDEVITGLVDGGHRVMTYVGRDHAVDDAEPGVTGADLVDDASAALRWLLLRDDVDLRRVGVLGCAVGAMVAAYLAGRTDQLAGLGLLAPIVPHHAIRRLERQAREQEQTAAENGEPEPEPSRLPGHLLRSLPEDDPLAAAARYDRPTLILHGAADTIAPVEASVSYAERIADAGHRVTHLLLARGDHVLSDDAVRAIAVRRMVDFFRALAPLPAGSAR